MTSYFTTQLWAFYNSASLLGEVCKESRDIFPTEPILEFSPHVLWVNQNLETIGIEDVRLLQADLNFSASENHTRYVIILHADKLTEQAQHALLKLLEEPGQYTQIILATDKPQKLLTTIRSRCVEKVFSNKNASQQAEKESEEVLKQFDSWCNLRVSQVISAAEQFKKRDQAKSVLEKVSKALRIKRMPKLTGAELHKTEKQLRNCVNALELLGKNIHTQLVMEDLFFTLNNLEAS